jgi:glycerophosphoryl diester phosphodiesterase
MGALSLVLIQSGCAGQDAPPMETMFLDTPLTSIAHRGASGHAPENTLPAFHLALELGAHALEMDLQLTADGYLVVLHDETVDRTTNGSGRIMDLKLEQVRLLDAGYRFQAADGSFPFRGTGIGIPTLDEILSAFPTTPLVLEMKPESGPEIAAALAAALERHGRDEHLIVASFKSAFLRDFRERMPGVPTALGVSETRNFFLLQFIGLQRCYRPPGQYLFVPESTRGIRVVTPRFLRAAEQLGLRVKVWTINEPDDMKRLAEMGVNGIVTDFPDLVRGVVPRMRSPAGPPEAPK